MKMYWRQFAESIRKRQGPVCRVKKKAGSTRKEEESNSTHDGVFFIAHISDFFAAGFMVKYLHGTKKYCAGK